MKALIVDDEDVNRKLLRIYLEMHGCEVVEAGNGLEGLDMAAKAGPDVIISDASMPVMNGLDFLREIKKDEGLRGVPFIFYTSFYKGDREYELAESLGADALISKPKTPDEFWAEFIRAVEGCSGKG